MRAREDKMIWLEHIGSKAEKSTENEKNRELYQATKKIMNKKRRQAAAVKNKEG